LIDGTNQRDKLTRNNRIVGRGRHGGNGRHNETGNRKQETGIVWKERRPYKHKSILFSNQFFSNFPIRRTSTN
jgi:hypothetical protein